MATRQVLKWIAKREAAIAKLSPPQNLSMKTVVEYDSENANEALCILGIAEPERPLAGDQPNKRRLLIATWATQTAISRPGRGRLSEEDVADIKQFTVDPNKLKWPRPRRL